MATTPSADQLVGILRDNVVELVRRDEAPVPVSRARLFALVDAAFAQRRKTVRNTLRSAGLAVDDIDRALARASVDPGARAEMLATAAVCDRVAAHNGTDVLDSGAVVRLMTRSTVVG